MSRIIFYSWQNDLNKKTHRYFIEKCLKKALHTLEKDTSIYASYDRDTKGMTGSPDISSVIFDKIDKAALFVCDISIVNPESGGRKMPNPNVLLELGYAVSKLGWDRVICLFDVNTGVVEDLPFDIRQKRVTPFSPEKRGEQNRISNILANSIQELFLKGKLFNPLNDYMKGRIDYSILEIVKQMANLLFGTVTGKEGLSRTSALLKMTQDKIEQELTNTSFPAFIVLNDFSDVNLKLREILKELLSSNYFPKEWCYTVLELIDWIRIYNHFISERNKETPFIKVESSEYERFKAIDAHAMNSVNPPNSFLIIEAIDNEESRGGDINTGIVINKTHYPIVDTNLFKQCYTLNTNSIQPMATRIYQLIQLCQNWLDITDSEFILDPDYYTIG